MFQIRPGAEVQFEHKLVDWPPPGVPVGLWVSSSMVTPSKFVCTAEGFGKPSDYGRGPIIVHSPDDFLSGACDVER